MNPETKYLTNQNIYLVKENDKLKAKIEKLMAELGEFRVMPSLGHNIYKKVVEVVKIQEVEK